MLEILLQAEESQCVCEQGTSLSSSQRGELDSSGQRGFLQQADLSSGRVSESSQSLAPLLCSLGSGGITYTGTFGSWSACYMFLSYVKLFQ